MRENRTCGSEGGEGIKPFPSPIGEGRITPYRHGRNKSAVTAGRPNTKTYEPFDQDIICHADNAERPPCSSLTITKR